MYLNLFTAKDYAEAVQLYPEEVMNEIEYTCIPRYELKVGLRIILLANLNNQCTIQGIIEGTRLIITRLGQHEIKEEVLTGDAAGKKLIIGRKVM